MAPSNLPRVLVSSALALASLLSAAWLVPACREGSAPTGDGGAAAEGREVPCDAGATCGAASLAGALSGDSDAGVVTARGTKAAWVHVRVTEDDSGWTGKALRVRAKLRGPGARNFSLHAYLDDSKRDDAGLDCKSERGRKTTSADGEELALTWGDPDDASANGADDGRTVAFEVRSEEGVCSEGAPWELEVRTE